ncbi:hypothetical protein DFS34DRAFT_653130 [Phlyctochytrium arcticum]|nr:hypothetical protein DFS34DRAFT_653130 [Phlyctochytrium arcticum]
MAFRQNTFLTFTALLAGMFAGSELVNMALKPDLSIPDILAEPYIPKNARPPVSSSDAATSTLSSSPPSQDKPSKS